MEPALKQRLIGAMVLVALAVIFLPMLIKGPAPESGASDVPLEMPATPQGEYQTRELPLTGPGDTAPAGGVVGMSPASDGTLPTVDTTTAAPATGSGGGMMPAPTAGGDYAVSFGSYATSADAARVVGALTASQLPGYQEPVTGRDGRSLYRVRIGPFAAQADAEAARLRAAHVRDDVGAKVVTLDASASAAPAAASSATSATTSVSQPLAAPTPSVSAPVALPGSTAAAKPAPTKPAVEKPVAEKLTPTKPTPTKPVATTTATPAPKPVAATPAPTPAAASKPAAAGTGFAVQLGAFGSADEANRLRDRARAAGFSAFVQAVRTDRGTLNRVRIGPVLTRAEADQLKAQVSAKLGVGGIVQPHP